MENSLEFIPKWLKKSGLKDNDEKTDLCLFYKYDTTSIVLNLGDIVIRSKMRSVYSGTVI
jgi:hypothetical protein